LPGDEHFLPETLSDAATHLEALHLAITETLDAEASRLRATGLDVTTEIVVGQAAPGILEHAIVDDVVVMTSHGTGGVRRWLLGSVAEKLIRSGAAPVILVPVRERRHLAEASALPAESTRG
jgi:nucleotide-binding universal stress UspA family protein